MVRNTSEDWAHIAASEPWYGVLSAPEFLSANVSDAAKDRFYEQGLVEMNHVMDTLRSLYGAFEPSIGVDFGAGLGRLAFAMSNVCAHVYAIDAAPSMLLEGAAQRDARGISNVEFLPALPDGVVVDWINSYITFQHIVPRLGYELLSGLLARLRPGGWLSLHVTYAHDQRDTHTLLSDTGVYRFDGETLTVVAANERPLGQMSMYDYDLNRVLFQLVSHGVNGFTLHATDHGGAHGFWIFGRRAG